MILPWRMGSRLHTTGSVTAGGAIDIVSVATPDPYHTESILTALRYGKHVLAETARHLSTRVRAYRGDGAAAGPAGRRRFPQALGPGGDAH